jgi:tetratricopeptide (TPR) repeat protein
MRINFKFLAVVVVVLALVGGSLFGLNRFQASRSADILLTQAREANESEDFAEAIRLYKQFLGFRPREAAVHEELGMLMADVGQFQPAYFHLETALRANPQNLEAQEKLVEVSIALGRNTDAKTRLNEQLLSQDDKNPKYQWLLGLCESSLGNSAEAKEYFTLAVEGAPGEPAYVGALANLLPTQEAKEKMDAMVEAGKDNPLCYFVRSNWLLQNPAANVETEESPQDLAWQDALQAHRLDGEDVRFVLLVSQAAIARQQVAEARDIVAKAIEAKPNLAELYSSAAQIELADGDVDSAMKCYERGLTALPKQTELIWGLAQLELDAGNIEAAKGRAQELRKLKYPDSALSFLDARILVAESKWRQAADLLEKSRALMDQNKDLLKQADFLLAGCYQQLGKADQEALVLRRALAIDPQWLPARQALANSLTRSGRIGEAISQLRQVVGSGNASPTAQLSLARLMFLDGRGADKADWTQLRKLLTHLEQFPELANDVAVIRAELLVNENKPAEAVQLLRDALKTSDNKQGLWQALVGLQVRNEQWDEAEATLEAAAAALSDDVPLRLEQARFLIRRDGPEVDIDRLKQLATPNTDWTEEQKSQLAYGFAGFFLSLEEYELCEEYAKIAAVAEQGQASLPIHLLLFDLALRSQDAKAMSDSLEKVKEIEGTGPLWRVGEAVRLMITAQDENNDEEKGRLYAQASQQLAEAAVERPDWPRIPRLQGDIFDQQGKTEQAVDSYLKAIELGEQNIDVVSRAISLLSAKGRYLDADKVIRKMQEQSNPFSSELNRVASQVSVQLQDYERALSFSEGWAAKSDQQEDHVFLAQVYRSTGKIAEAEQELRVALDLDPTSPAAWVTLVQLYYDANDFRCGEQDD